MEKVNLPLDRQHSAVLLRFLSLVTVNMQLHPDKYDFKATEVKEVLEHLDYLIHEKAHWCDAKDCSYWIKKKRMEELKQKIN